MATISLRLALLLIGGLFYSCLHAQENMQFTGTLIEPPPCTINQGKMIDVSFGEHVAIAKVDGAHYQQTIDYQLTCNANAAKTGLTLTLRGTASAFDAAAVQTTKPGLGIRLILGERPFTLNTPFTVDMARLPALFAVPVSEKGATLTEGQFDATATLLAEYR
ncbi:MULTISPECIES: fimbrial protein [Tenebrionibacter/Tenebrionicola group]|jgi:type 1 fimbria pilin|uniref:Fimbrial protein n=2 Tax=Tenebrionibacter/Tenebrionicola group TaxID=2969848 RepID=A0A8K0XW32_9ENTR|nr:MULTISPECIES: fimbrial protein [Tenebrionibacter/Tenebrionicola group]MBK4714646.1 fimbrial protein [Tenebrionibacter intestinalis]MBV4413715.1 fimbrial protein [Tenebrionicola larvae]MBV5095100.1 fimbrial protein [Tenebrionicola larvae]